MTGTEALLIAGALALAWVLVRFAEMGVDVLLRRRGLPTGDHCEPNPEADPVAASAELRAQLTSMCDVARDHLAVLAAVRADIEQQAEHVRGSA